MRRREMNLMHSRFPPLLRNEFAKAVRRKLPYFGIAVVGVVCLLTYSVAGHINNAASANAWGYVAFSMQIVFSDVGPVFIIVFSAMLLSEETEPAPSGPCWPPRSIVGSCIWRKPSSESATCW